MGADQTQDLGNPAPKLKVFVSYSRQDLPATEKLVAALEARGIEVLIDRRDLPLAVDFQKELLGFIRQADTVLYVLSPASVGSHWCNWELEQVAALGKRLAPAVVASVADDQVPDGIRKINYVFFTGDNAEGAGFEAQADALARALKTDLEWIKEHTRIGELARRWQERGRGGLLVLRGAELDAAEAWSTRQPLEAPPLSENHRAFIAASRRAATRRQRGWLVGSAAVTMLALSTAAFAFLQRNEAQSERDKALVTQSRYLSDLSSKAMSDGQAEKALLLALAALPEGGEAANRPLLPAASTAFFATWPKVAGTGTIFTDPEGLYTTFAFNPRKDRLLAATEDGTVRIRDLDGAQGVVVLKGHEKPVRRAVFTADGARVVTGADDNTARVWDTHSGQQLAIFKEHTQGIQTISLSRDGSVAVTTAGGRITRVWNTRTGAQLRSLEPYGSGAEINADGTMVLLNATPHVLWDLITMKAEGTKGSQHYDKALFTPDGNHIVAFGGFADGVEVLDARTGRLVMVVGRTEKKSRVVNAFVTPSGRRLVAASDDQTVRVFDFPGGKEGHRFIGGPRAILTRDETRIVLSSGVWDIASGQRIFALPGGGEAADTKTGLQIFARPVVAELELTADEQRLLVAQGGTVRLYDFASGSEIASVSGPQDRTLAMTLPDGRSRILAATSEGVLRAWSVEPEPNHSLQKLPKEQRAELSFTKLGVRAAFIVDRTASVWNVENGERLAELTVAEAVGGSGPLYANVARLRKIAGAHFSRDGSRLVTRSEDSTVRVWDIASGTTICRAQLVSPTSAQLFLASDGLKVKAEMSPDRLRLASAYPDRGVAEHSGRVARLHSLADCKLLSVLEGHGSEIESIAFSPDSTRMATGSNDSIRLWDAKTGAALTKVEGFARPAGAYTGLGGYPATGSLRFSSDGKYLLASHGQVAQIWDVETGASAAKGNWGDLLQSSRMGGEGKANAPSSAPAFVFTESGVVYDRSRPRPNTLSADGTKWLEIKDDEYRLYNAFPVDGSLAEFSKSRLARCLTPKEREAAFLPLEPPNWCIDLGKFPYHTPAWKEWRTKRAAAVTPVMPGVPQ